MGNDPFLKNGTSKAADSITQLTVFEENGSGKGSQMAPTLIKPMGNHQTSAPESIFCTEYFLYTQKSISSGKWQMAITKAYGK